MALIEKEEAHIACNPYFRTFTSVINNAWESWLANDVARRLVDKRARASVLRNDVLFYLKTEIEDSKLDGIKYVKVPHQEGFLIGDRYFVRVKKGNKSMRSSNYPTQRALDFHNPDVELFGGLIRLELIYILSDDGVGVDKIVLTQRNGKYVAWALDLTAENVYSITDFESELDVDVNQPETTVPVAKTVVRSKRARKQEPKVENGRGD
ncbi:MULTISPECIES: hypothetical protein [Enterobacterales]|uniref:Uncharacterized protein n=1 Tax=Serratia marcescens TaxID=615 RepID=A0A2F0PQU8_SERMA|nr:MULTISPECIES: hypothetical protein [Enterobacterales]AUY12855.1 hypothetical protein C3F38_02635 [Serratia sp. SSNIH1]KYC15490.1 hypothetical protein WM45_21680 [Citrobacter sp. AATXR]MCS1419291.1 hypothetical protein [Citrobacter portucalensis]MDX7509888.1 hypothetical protein [Citrobacter freundii]OCO79808.1 hypothetical protein AN694_0214140 [Serratia marcescens]